MQTRMFCLMLISMVIFSSTGFAKEVSGKIDMHFDLSRYAADQAVELWIPYPVSDANQLIENIEMSGDYSRVGVYTDQEHGAAILYAKWEKGGTRRTLDFSFSATRKEVVRRDFPKTEPAWNPADYAKYLRPTRYGPIDGEVKKLADKITMGKSTVLAKAKAIYDWTCENMYREPKTIGCGKGNVCKLLETPGGKCTDIHSVYVALCRAAGVPAREILGIRQGKKNPADITGWQHCWAQFFLPGYGWVPVDPADVRKGMLKGNLEPDDPKTDELRTYFWGAIDPYRIKLNEGRDLILNPKQMGEPLNTFGYPYAEVGGKMLDFYNPSTFTYSITYYRK